MSKRMEGLGLRGVVGDLFVDAIHEVAIAVGPLWMCGWL